MGQSAASTALRPRAPLAPAISCQLQATRGYRHWWRVLPEDFELNTESMPKDIKTLMASDPTELGFVDHYWYWRIRSESTIMDPENLPKKSYAELCRDMGLTPVNTEAEHVLGVIELYEYLKSSHSSAHSGQSRTQSLFQPSTLNASWVALEAAPTASTCLYGSDAERASSIDAASAI